MSTACHLSAPVLLSALQEARCALQWYADDARHHVARQALESIDLTIEAATNAEFSAKKLFRNQYRCDRCAHDWEDEWDCACNDRCPLCNVETEPHTSDESPE